MIFKYMAEGESKNIRVESVMKKPMSFEEFNAQRDELERNLGREAEKRKAWEVQTSKDKGRDKRKK